MSDDPRQKIAHIIVYKIITTMYQYQICIVLVASAVLMLSLVMDPYYLVMLLAAGAIGWVLTNQFIHRLKVFMLRAEVFGLDINKKGSEAGEKPIPECVGFASAIAFLMVGLLYYSSTHYLTHLACFLTITCTIMLGFADDMLDLPWRYKLVFPFFIIIPVITVYSGSTDIPIPYPFAYLLGSTLDLGYLFYLYITMLAIYCTNTINIYAGINGLEVGQSIVASCCLLVLMSVRALFTGNAEPYQYSAFILLLFMGVSLALMKENAYPSKVFVGDTYCYFAGIVFALAAMYSNTAIACQFLLIPQLINFLYSVPQLFGFYQCPRHRLTQYNPSTNLLSPIRTNMNLLNLTLRIIGPCNEGVLCDYLLLFQCGCGVMGIVLGAYFM